MSILALLDADASCGAKAHSLARLMRAGLPVPDGFVVARPQVDPEVVAEHLNRLGGGPVAVRSSGRDEDGLAASFAGQYETVLGVRGLAEVLAAVRLCASSAHRQRVHSYRAHLGLPGEAEIPVLVESLVEADQSGVLFTRDPRTGEDNLVINASWGLGESVVSGAVDPDEVIVAPSGRVSRLTIGSKQTRVDAGADGLAASLVAPPDRARACLTPRQITQLAELGRRCEHLFGCPQDVEWAIRDGRVWVLQSRPVTTITPSVARDGGHRSAIAPVLTGMPASPGRAEGPARLVRSVDEFCTVLPGDVLVCRTTDPAWTPLFRVVAAVVTETGGALCHAAIVAREFGLPAIAGAEGAMALLTGGQLVVDGSLGTVTTAIHPQRHP